jgi:hypothetical protein
MAYLKHFQENHHRNRLSQYSMVCFHPHSESFSDFFWLAKTHIGCELEIREEIIGITIAMVYVPF